MILDTGHLDSVEMYQIQASDAAFASLCREV
jgi:hypothetical protein